MVSIQVMVMTSHVVLRVFGAHHCYYDDVDQQSGDRSLLSMTQMTDIPDSQVCGSYDCIKTTIIEATIEM